MERNKDLFDIIKIFLGVYRDLGNVPIVALERASSERSANESVFIEHIPAEKVIFLPQGRVRFCTVGKILVMKDVKSKRLGKILVFIGERVAGDEVRDFLPLFLRIERLPRYIVKYVGRISEKSFLQIEDIDYMSQFVDKNLDLLGITLDSCRERQLVPCDLPPRLLAFGIEHEIEGSDF